MRRVFNKTLAFCLVLLMSLGIITPWIEAYATDSNEYILKILAANEYSDAVRFGEGYLLLKNGTFDSITSETTYTFVDESGNTRELKNNVGFTEIYLNTSGNTYYVDYGVLAIGKNGKVALMDIDGNLYGGSNNFYDCVIHAGDNLFYTTNDTAGSSDKAATTVWTLRRKDGSVVKEFTNLNLGINRVHANGYEYLRYENNGEYEYIAINSNGDITVMGRGYENYSVYGEAGYVVLYKYSESGNGYLMSVFNADGTKAFEIDNCYYIGLDSLSKYGYGNVEVPGEHGYSANIINKKGEFLFENGKYETVLGYDGSQGVVIDYDANMYLVDSSDNVIFDIDKFAKGLGESYKAITFSTYYIDSTLAVSFEDKSKENDVGVTFFFDDKGQQIAGNIKGKIPGWGEGSFNGEYALIYDNECENYGVISKDGKFEKRGYEDLSIQSDPNESDIVAIANKSSDNSKILIMKDGSENNKYDQLGTQTWPQKMYVNGHLLVKAKGKEQYGIIDIHGNEIIPVGQYNNFVQYDDSECILGYKDGKPYLFDTNGNALNDEGKYKNIGNYVTNFYKFASNANWTTYTDYLSVNNITITKDYSDKLGLVQVVKTNEVNFDVNGDGKIDIEDISKVALKYNVNSTDSKWDSTLDFNKDNIIDVYDLTLIAIKV